MSGRSSTRTSVLLLVALAATGCKRTAPDSAAAQVTVAAAADLSFAFKEVGAEFEKRTGKHVVFTFGSTGNLAKQIAEGAKYDLFAAANEKFADEAVASGACDGSTKHAYARGRIAVWWKKGASVAPPKSLAVLADARFVKVAIANPEHAPYGQAAQQAMTAAGVWETVKPKLVYGENIQ